MEEPKVEQSYQEHVTSINKDGDTISLEVPYIVSNVTDEKHALCMAKLYVPDEQDGLNIDRYEIDEKLNDTTYRVNAVYESKSSPSSGGSEEEAAEDATMSFDCGGGTKHLTHALVAEKIAFGTKPAGNAIGWNGKTGAEMQITGVDVPTAQLRETYTKVMRLGDITTGYKRKAADLVGKVNNDPFKGWDSGEVMFLGMSYSTPTSDAEYVTVTFNFAIQLNEKGVDFAGHLITKFGWDYAWALSKSVVNNGVPATEVEAIYINRVCRGASFASLGI